MPTLYIKGETGATLDATRRTLGSLNIVGGLVKLAVLATEEFSWKVSSESLTAGDTIIPDNGQKVSLYLDEVRIFHGHVVATEVIGYGVKVRVAGPWWWLSRQDATSDQDDEEGTTAERPILQFGVQGWDDSITDLMAAAENDFGLPVTMGTVPSYNDLPVLRYPLSSVADVLTRLTQWCGDAVPWWNHRSHVDDCQAATSTTIQLASGASDADDAYNGLEIEMRSGANAAETRVITDYVGATRTATISTAWTVTPTAGDTYALETKVALHVTRRGSAAATTYTLGSDPIVEPLSFQQRSELQVTRVELPYVDRDGTTGALQYQSQASGTLSAGQRQIVPVAGPELTDFLPEKPEDLGMVLTIDTTTTDLATALKDAIPGYAELVADFAEGGANWLFKAGNISTSKSVAAVSGDGSSLSGLTASWSNPSLGAGRSFITFENGLQPPEWAIASFGLTPYIVSHWAWVDGNSGSTTPAFDTDRRRALLKTLGGDYYWNASKTDPSGPSPPAYQWCVRDHPNLKLWTIATADIPAGGKLVRDPYSFFSPPSGLAAAMLAASNWVPWQGTVTRHLEELTAEEPFSKKYNLAGTLTAAASAAALPKSYQINLDTNIVTLNLGPPDRLDYPTLVGRTQRSGSENIVEL